MMQKTVLSIGLSTALVLGTSEYGAAESVRRLLVGVDISDSFVLTTNDALARDAGRLVKAYVAGMQPGDLVTLRSLGAAGLGSQQLRIDVKLGRRARYRPRRLAPQLGDVLASIPARVRAGRFKIQTRTNIIGFLEAFAPSLDCAATPTLILIFSDGIEWSTRVRGDALLSGKQTLPTPQARFLKGCNVELRGLGQGSEHQGTDTRWFARLSGHWTRFFKAAGAARFRAYGEFK